MSANTEFAETLDSLEVEIPALGLALSLARLQDRLASFAIGEAGQSQLAIVADDSVGAPGSEITGRATANATESFDDALAFGLLAGADLFPGGSGLTTQSDDHFSGHGVATGTGQAESRGVSFGTEDNSVGDPEVSLPDEDAPLEGAPVEDAPVEGAPGDEAPTVDAPPDGAPVEGEPVLGAPVEEAPVAEAPTEGAPAEGAPVEDAPVAGTPIVAAPIEDAPVEDAPIDDSPVEDAPVEAPNVADAPAGDAPMAGAPEDGAPEDGAPEDGAPEDGAPEEAAPGAPAPEDGAPIEGEEEDFGPSPEDFIANLTVTARFGAGNDTIEGTATTTVDATDPNGEGFELIFAGANGVIVDVDSRLLLGLGDDLVQGTATLTSRSNPVTDNGEDGSSAGDADLEVIADGVENAGEIFFGAGDDTLIGTASADAVGGATAIADGVDTSSVGNANVAGTEMRFGEGNDTVIGRGTSRSEGDGSLGNGFDNRAIALFGSGDDLINAAGSATFIDDATQGDQEEAIADGIENRGTIVLGQGNDRIQAQATATGNGVLTIADGIDSRGLPGLNPFDEDRGIALSFGAGDDFVRASGRAIQTEDLAEGTVNQDNQRTVASGMLNQNVDSSAVLFGSGDDTVLVDGFAQGDDNPTLAFGMSNISFDLPNDGADGILGTPDDLASLLRFGRGDDLIVATATGSVADTGPESDGDVVAFGYWGGLTNLGSGRNVLEADATINAAVNAHAHGISVDDDIDLINGVGNEPFETSQGAGITGGRDADLISGTASIFDAIGSDIRANGIFIGADGTISTRRGDDTVRGDATIDGDGAAFGIFGEVGALIDTGSGDDTVQAGAAGFGGGFDLVTRSGNDQIQGFGDVNLFAGSGHDTLDVSLFGTRADFEVVDADADGRLEALVLGDVSMGLNESVETIIFQDQVLLV